MSFRSIIASSGEVCSHKIQIITLPIILISNCQNYQSVSTLIILSLKTY